ncbi:MAG: hypothetical protein M0Q53_21100 [Prolixibacteraceae bacterium]|jgi:hypothetical protein|nr:hypothetical protein [Prolixibacteraceae bacterium]
MAEKSNHKVIKEVEMIKILSGSSKKRFSEFKAGLDNLKSQEERMMYVMKLVSFLADPVAAKENKLESFAKSFFEEYGPLIAQWLHEQHIRSQKIAIRKENKEITIGIFRTLFDMNLFGDASESVVADMIKRTFDFGDINRYLLRDFRQSKGICKSKTMGHIERFLVVKKSA